jgi:hypothetical protein
MEEIMTVSIYPKEGPWMLPFLAPQSTDYYPSLHEGAQSLPEHGILPLVHKVQQRPAAGSSLYT